MNFLLWFVIGCLVLLTVAGAFYFAVRVKEMWNQFATEEEARAHFSNDEEDL